MKESKIPASPKPLETVRNLIQDWRRDKQGRRSMPEELWQAAADLARQSSVNRIAKELRLNNTALMKRVNRHENSNLPAAVQEAEFIALNTVEPVFGCGCEVELEKSCGSKLKIKYTAGMGINIVQLWSEFLQHS